MDRIEWVIESCRLLRAIGDEIAETQPFAGLTIGTGIHLEPKTVALLLALQRGGAELVSTGNLNTTQQDACYYLAARGVRVVGGPTSDPAEHDRFLWEVVRARPDLILDNGGDLFVRWLDEPYDTLRGGTEETTSGRRRLEPLRDRLRLRRLRQGRRGELPQRVRNRLGRGRGSGRAARGHARRVPGARPR